MVVRLMIVRWMIGRIRGWPETEIEMPRELLGCQKQTDWHRLSHFGAKASLSMFPFRTVEITAAISRNFADMGGAAAGKKYFTIVSFLVQPSVAKEEYLHTVRSQP